MTVNMEKVLEYRDILRECIELQSKIDVPDINEYLNALKECVALEKELLGEQPKQDKPKPPKERASRVDHGRILALHKAGWTQEKIAEDVKCSVNTVYNVVKAYREGQEAANG